MSYYDQDRTDRLHAGLPVHNKNDWEVVTEHRTCFYHKRHPNTQYAGCTCGTVASYKRKQHDPESGCSPGLADKSLTNEETND